MNTTKPSIRKFNPGTFQSDDELIRQFVVRKHELQIVLEVLSENIDAKSCQHILVAGPRGRGKTMLLARVCAELRKNEALSQHLLPVRFMEESQEVTNLADFWLEALFHLAKTTAAVNPEFSEELLVTHKDLAVRWQDSNFEEMARAAVLGAADRIGRKLVLMVENLQSLSADLDSDFGWKLRKTLQSEPQIILLATATSQFKELRDADEPFFELFRIVHLEPLSVAECAELWRMASGEERDSREIKPLRILTGGSPRLLVIVATYAEHRSLRQLLEELVALVDDHTEYFRGHLETIAKTERRVYLAVLDLWQASSPAEIASRARMDVRSVSALLARLADRGIVLVEGSGRKRLYAAAERLYSIYYKLRRERDEATLVQNFIQFMTVFYSSQKLDEIFDVIRLEAVQSPAIREGFQRAMASDIADTKGVYRKTALAIDLDTADKHFSKVYEHIQNGEQQMAIEVCEQLVEYFGGKDSSESKSILAFALKLLAELQELLGRGENVLRTCEDFETRYRKPGQDRRITFRLCHNSLAKAGTLFVLNRRPAALEAFRTACFDFDPDDPGMVDLLIAITIRIVAAGAPAGELAEILSAQGKGGGVMETFVIALRMHAGESVRAPAEVLEVAEDILEQIENDVPMLGPKDGQ